MTISEDNLKFIINHVGLPPRLPQQEDTKSQRGEEALLELVHEQVTLFIQHHSPAEAELWQPTLRMLTTWRLSVGSNGSINTETLSDTLAQLRQGDSIAVYIREQNAGLFIQQKTETLTTFSAFEASALSEQVLEAKSRLIRRFPGRCIEIDTALLHNTDFRAHITRTLQQMDTQRVEEYLATSAANAQTVVQRESASPVFVTEHFMSILAAIGEPVTIEPIYKRTREDVLWTDSTKPWRRSPFWLLLRVAIQLSLSHAYPHDSKTQYKNFMIILVSSITKLSLDRKSSSEIKFLLSAKLARRIYKLGSQVLEFVSREALTTVRDIRTSLDACWTAMQESEKILINPLECTTAAQDVSQRLTHSRVYLQEAMNRTAHRSEVSTFFPEHTHRILFDKDFLPPPLGSYDEESLLSLADVEYWVRMSLDAWVKSNPGTDEHCTSLAALIDSYIALGVVAYKTSPRHMSLMLLTVLQLWVALDKISLQLYPLLSQFSPEIPPTLLEPLLLPKLNQMKRLQDIESYLNHRHSEVAHKTSSMFASPHSQSFATQFYESSEKHKKLRAEIEKDALARRVQKEREFKEKQGRHQTLMQQAANLACTYNSYEDGITSHDSLTCQKCKCESEADSIWITHDEWPLPDDEVQIQTVIFELDCPRGFAAWRDSTWFILQRLGRNGKVVAGKPVQEEILRYQLLSSYASDNGQRLSLGSSTKSYLDTHFKGCKIPTLLENVCVSNALQCHLLDRASTIWTAKQKAIPSFQPLCVTPLPIGPYSSLQYTVDSWSHRPNRIVSEQQNCSPAITLHEFYAYGTLRAGEHLQWCNILRELGSSDLSFNEEAVHTLILQACWQAGPPMANHERRTSHAIFEHADFPERLLDMLDRKLRAIELNWKEQYTMSTIVQLALRVLSLAMAHNITDRAIDLLQQARFVTARWLRELTARLQDNTDEKAIEKSCHLVLRAASTCLATYDVDNQHAATMLRGTDDIAIFLECLILVHDNTPNSVDNVEPNLQRCLVDNQKISHSREERLRQRMMQGTENLNTAFSRLWEGVTFASNSWAFQPAPNQRWITNSTIATTEGHSQSFLLNILTGRLLIDGIPPSRMPPEYTNHPLYQKIFGARVMQVFESNLPTMSYMSARRVHSQQLHFALRNGQLLIRTADNGESLEIIPQQQLEGDFPKYFITNFVHWLNLANGELEFRPLRSMWQASQANWRLCYREDSISTMRLKNQQLIDGQSQTAKRISDTLSVLEQKTNMHFILRENGSINVELPRFNIKFFVNDNGLLESKELAAIVDQDQSLGVLHGLKNKMVLRSQKGRSVLIPFGHVATQIVGDHIFVEIKIGDQPRVRYFHYDLDLHLRKLRSPPGLLAPLYKAYLHALTTFHLPDPFTQRTGTEEALTNLREANLRSFSPLEDEVLKVLTWISELTPFRKFYPKNLRKMQQVTWNNNLGQLAQHDDFDVVARSIAAHAARFGFLNDQAAKECSLNDRGDKHLLSRARVRNSTYRLQDYGGNAFSLQDDHMYDARDCVSTSARARRVYETTSLIKRWPQRLEVTSDLVKIVEGWGFISGYQQRLDFSSFANLINLNFSNSWGSLYNLCRSSTREEDTYKLIFLFGPIAFGPDKPLTLIRTVLAFAFSDRFRQLSAPTSQSFNLEIGVLPRPAKLKAMLEGNCLPFPEKGKRPRLPADKEAKHQRQVKYKKDLQRQINTCKAHLINEWPSQLPTLPPASQVPLIRVPSALTACRNLFGEWHRNKLFMEHINEVNTQLAEVFCEEMVLDLPDQALAPPVAYTSTATRATPSLHSLIVDHKPTAIEPAPTGLTAQRLLIPSRYQDVQNELSGIIAKLRLKSDTTHQEYANDLQQSYNAFKVADITQIPQGFPFSVDILVAHSVHLMGYVEQMLVKLRDCLKPSSVTSKILSQASLWPRLTPHTLLSLLSSSHKPILSKEWGSTLVAYGEAITTLQRSERLVRLARAGDVLGFYKEAESTGREGWLASEHPEWILLEIENDFTIRRLQARVAQQMIKPATGSNSVLQLNMGEGKSSVIIPMVAATLADKQRLVRIIVLKPLLKQTTYLLSQRLGGLVNRRIYHTPFSRKTQLDADNIKILRSIYKECMNEGGILLALPEHILSFRLLGRERLPFDLELAGALMEAENWLQQKSRDLLDESDEILNTKFQLIYTVGAPQHLDGQPDRWTIAQAVLSRVEKQAGALCERHPTGITLERKGDKHSFPIIRFLQPALADALVSLVIEDVGKGYVKGISFDHCTTSVRAAALKFVSNRAISGEDLRLVTGAFANSTLMGKLLLLRGLFAHEILRFTLQRKRWLVDYGLDSRRSLLSVPYKAKGVPSLSSEFGHPEVAIILTCLSYYYTGLDSGQLRRCFNALLQEIDPSHEYHRWCLASESLPVNLRTFDGVNLDDEQLWENQLFPCLRYSKPAIDYFLSNVVFPREGKEFVKKLSASSWDIPTASQCEVSTGFSGTNDNRFLLPLSIQQHDMKELRDTNARVLNQLLQTENRAYVCAENESGHQCSVESFLSLLSRQKPEIRVLINVGAMVLDMQNIEVAREWLSYVPHAEASVFFDEKDEIMVLDRQGNVERLLVSPFHYRLNDCLVYLDEVHTRGIDLDLPTSARGAITLGPRLTKDRLVQACCRLRKLGSGQSLQFFAGPDVNREILDLSQKYNGLIDSSDVILWSLEQTCQITEQAKALWTIQGFEHHQRTQSYAKLLHNTQSIQKALADPERVSQYLDSIQVTEAQTLHLMYGIHSEHVDPNSKFTTKARQDPIVQKLSEVWCTLRDPMIRDTSVHEEQEREIAHEIEREQEIQRPSTSSPNNHTLHPNTIHFMNHGKIRPSGIIPAFETLQNTSISRLLESTTPCAGLYATVEFSNTVNIPTESHNDDYVRPVNWILSSSLSEVLLIISPYEANKLFTKIQSSETARLHLYAPKTTKAMVSFGDLSFFTIPSKHAREPWPTSSLLQSLNLFSGSLYFDSYTHYKNVCEFLAIVIDRNLAGDDSDVQLATDGFANAANRQALGWSEGKSPFETSPLPFFKGLLGFRRKGQDFLQTHMGDLVSGRVLKEDAFS